MLVEQRHGTVPGSQGLTSSGITTMRTGVGKERERDEESALGMAQDFET